MIVAHPIAGQFPALRNKRKFLWKLTIAISDGIKTKKRGSRSCRAIEDTPL
jgi:hypothetical protein